MVYTCLPEELNIISWKKPRNKFTKLASFQILYIDCFLRGNSH